MHFMSRKKNMKKSNDRHDNALMHHDAPVIGVWKRYGIIMYNVELSRPSGPFSAKFGLIALFLMATGSYPRIIR